MTGTAPARKRPAWWNPNWSGKVWIMVVLLLIPTLGFALWVLSQAGGQSEVDPETFAIASENAGGSITAITGTEHTVYHANGPVVDPKTPREDGRVTLVWFTETSCGTCDKELFVHTVMAEFRSSAVFVEKELGRSPAAQRLGVKDVPTFVWLDAEGTETGRFGAVADEPAFRAEVAKVLGPAR
ncbi:MAG: hypothetical protein WBO97_04625 [Tepidiformaceae bacterium]